MNEDLWPQLPQGQYLGMVVDGSLERGLEVRLEPPASVEGDLFDAS